MKRDTGKYGLAIEYIRNLEFLSLVAKILTSSSPSSSSTLNSLTIIYLTAYFAVNQPIIIHYNKPVLQQSTRPSQ